MSEWIDIEKKELKLSDDKTEVYAYLESDDFGARYINLKVEDLKELLETLNNK